MLAGELLANSAARNPAATAIVAGGRTLSYAAFDGLANQAANALLAHGLRPGDRVAVLGQNLPEYGALYFGAARAGLVLVNLSLRSTARDLAYILDQTAARVLVYDPSTRDRVDQARAGLADLAHCIAFGPALDRVLAGTADVLPDIPLSPDDPFCLTYTGGTTGRPKGVLVSQRARCALAETVGKEFGFTSDDLVSVETPLFHIAGLFVCFQPAIALGCPIHLSPSWNVEGFVDAVERHGITATMLVPTQLRDVVSHTDFRPDRLRSLGRVVHAGAPMAESLLDRLRESLPWVEFIENYGQSEIGPATVRRGADLPDKAGSIGRALSGVELAILGEDGREVTRGEIGELACRGANLLVEYYHEPTETAALHKFGGGWLATGDLGVMDRDGFITLVERLRDMIISGGENLYPVEIEAALDAHPAVAECAVFGIPDTRLGEVPAAHVVSAAGARVSAEELIEFCAGRVGRFKRPRLIRFVDSLPRTAIGKVQKNQIREPYWQGGERRV